MGNGRCFLTFSVTIALPIGEASKFCPVFYNFTPVLLPRIHSDMISSHTLRNVIKQERAAAAAAAVRAFLIIIYTTPKEEA